MYFVEKLYFLSHLLRSIKITWYRIIILLSILTIIIAVFINYYILVYHLMVIVSKLNAK